MTIEWSNFQKLTEGNIQSYVPTSAGVYLLWVQLKNENWRCYYVGKANDLKQRLLDHLSDNEPNDCIKEKVKKYEELKEELNLTDEEVGYVGDEIIDLGVMEKCGFPVAPANADPLAKEVAVLVTTTAGGEGVVREVAEFILKAQGKWDKTVEMVKKKGF